ncbi:MAG: hypothetical protein IKO10_12670 [Lachnospiraceae bacterium]|nr:hypothetical protein [Lachnospiraceae bacterium]
MDLRAGSKIICIVITVSIVLCGCAHNQTQEVNSQDILVSNNSIKWESEYEYVEIENFGEIDNINMGNLLVMSVIPHNKSYFMMGFVPTVESTQWNDYYTDYSICFIFRDGYVYCANEYFYENIESEPYCLQYTDEMWDHLYNVFCIGRLSFEEVNQLEEWIDIADLSRQYTDFESDGYFNGNIPIYMQIFRSDLPISGNNVLKPNYKMRTSADEDIKLDGSIYIDDSASNNIIKWFEDSSFYYSWNKHIQETVTCNDLEPITPDLTEEEINNMSDEKLLHWGGLARYGLLINVEDLSQIEEYRLPDFVICGVYRNNVCIGEYLSDEEGQQFLNRYYISCLNEAVITPNGYGMTINTEKSLSRLFAGLWKDSWMLVDEGEPIRISGPDLIKQIEFKDYSDPETKLWFDVAQ